MISNKKRNAGTITANRYSYQVSQALLYALERCNQDDFVIIIDHEDDLIIYDGEAGDNVCYYQIKTSDLPVKLKHAIEKEWIKDLYEHVVNVHESATPHANVEKSTLVTSSPLLAGDMVCNFEEICFADISSKEAVEKIVESLHRGFGIPAEAVKIEKLFHSNSILSVKAHGSIARNTLASFLNARFKGIKFETIDSIYNALCSLLTNKETAEHRKFRETFQELKNRKAFRKRDFEDVVEKMILIAIPSYEEVEDVLSDSGMSLAAEYVHLSGDIQKNLNGIRKLYERTLCVLDAHPLQSSDVSIWQYVRSCAKLIKEDNSNRLILSGRENYYVEMLIVFILINKSYTNE